MFDSCRIKRVLKRSIFKQKKLMEWMINTQLGRRNIPPQQRVAVVQKFKKKIQEQANIKKEESDKQFYGNRFTGKVESSPNGEKSKSRIHTDKELAKMAGVGTGTVARYDAVMEWMLDIQLGRRNLSPIQRIAVAEKYRPIYEKQAKERQAEYHGNQYEKKNIKSGLTENLPQVQKERNPTTDKYLSDIADVSEKTYRMGAKILNSDNEDLKQRVLSGKTAISADLIETNIRQRGDVGGSAKKVGLRIKELERLYGVRDGSANERGVHVGAINSFTQKDIADKLGMDVRTLQNYKLLAEMIPELEDLVDTGIVY